MFSDIIYLTPITSGKNEIGYPKEIQGEPRQVYANKKSVRQNEFYQAAATGLKPEVMFEIRSFEYEGEHLLTHENKEYRIIRTFEKDKNLVELICSGLVNEVS